MASERVIRHLRDLAEIARQLEKEAATPKARHSFAELATGYETFAQSLERQTIPAQVEPSSLYAGIALK